MSSEGDPVSEPVKTQPTSPREMLQDIDSLESFKNILKNNPGWVIIKFGAEWCRPCKQIESHILEWFQKMPDFVQTVWVDVDESFELYAFMKSKKMINGIPALLAYKKGNESYVFDDNVVGANPKDVDMFFKRCLAGAGKPQTVFFPLHGLSSPVREFVS